MRYKNIRTGAVIETTAGIKGEEWVEIPIVRPPKKKEPAPPPAPAEEEPKKKTRRRRVAKQ